MQVYRTGSTVGWLWFAMLAAGCNENANPESSMTAGTTAVSSSAGSAAEPMASGTASRNPPTTVATAAGTNGGAEMLSEPTQVAGSGGKTTLPTPSAGAP